MYSNDFHDQFDMYRYLMAAEQNHHGPDWLESSPSSVSSVLTVVTEVKNGRRGHDFFVVVPSHAPAVRRMGSNNILTIHTPK